MKKLLLAVLAAGYSCLSYSQYCTGGPSQTIDSNLESAVLVGATGSINYTGCPGVTGVEEYFSEVTYLDAGQQYTLDVLFGTCGGNFSGAGEAWIDFNGDQVFDPSESIGTWSGTPPTAISNFTFNVPAGVSNGLTRMRINQQEGGVLPLDPCATFTWGSSTDFYVYLQNGVDCSGYVGNDESDPRIVNSLPFQESYNSQICYTNNNTVYSAPDVFYLLLLDNTDAVTVSLCGSSFDTFLSIMKTNGEIIGVNDDETSCGTSSELTVNTSGLDSLFVIVDGWGTQSGDYEIEITDIDLGIFDSELDNIEIYPNPASDIITIEGVPLNANMQLYDAKGKVVTTVNSTQISLNHLESGIYFLLIDNNQSKIRKKIIKR